MKELEILKLKKMLEDAGIPFEYSVKKSDPCGFIFGLYGDRHHLCYPKEKPNDRVCSVIYGQGTYGYETGLLEIMGLLTDEEEKSDSVVGYLTAKEVFERIKNHWEKSHDKAYNFRFGI